MEFHFRLIATSTTIRFGNEIIGNHSSQECKRAPQDVYNQNRYISIDSISHIYVKLFKSIINISIHNVIVNAVP